MKKYVALLLILVLCLTTLNGCFAASYLLGKSLGREGTAKVTAAPTRSARPDKPDPTRAPTAQPDATAAVTADPGVEGEDWQPAAIQAYFERVGFCDAGDSGKFVVKWTSSIMIEVVGQPNDADRATLDTIVGQFQQVGGMPAISFVTSGGNVRIGYLPKSRGTEVDASYNGEDLAHVFMSWDDYNNMTSCNIIVTDEMTDQTERDSNLIGFLFRGLGLAEDPNYEYPDSILNFNEIVALPNTLDWIMLMLLYDAQIAPGMPAGEAMAVVRVLVPDGNANADPTATPEDSITNEALLSYFNEVGFYWAEGAADGVVLKWGTPITLQVVGTPSEADRQLLDGYIGYLNTIEGFPGITEVASDGAMALYYLPYSELLAVPDFADMAREDGSYYWIYWDDYYSIYKCSIAIATDQGDPAYSRSQFLGVLYRSLGFLYNSSYTYADSILNPDSMAQDWSSMDWAMAALLYHSAITPGATRTDVMAMLNSGQ